MNEVSYVLEGFERKFAPFKGQKILLHGSREYARAIVERYDPVFHFAGIMSFDSVDPLMFPGLPVIDQDDLSAFDPDLIILTERVKYAERAYCSLRRICKEVGIPIFNMYGLDEVWLHREAEKPVPESLEEWIDLSDSFLRECSDEDLEKLREVLDSENPVSGSRDPSFADLIRRYRDTGY